MVLNEYPWQAFQAGELCGFDEAGRGPLAGPVSAAAVILNPQSSIEGLADSKVLSAKKRDYLACQIKEKALAWGQAFVWPDEIESLNIHQASLKAMRLAYINLLEAFPEACTALKIMVFDGKFVADVKDLAPDAALFPQVKGDSLVAEISAASILAKTTRDQYMLEEHAKDPRYGFASHMGYPTKAHKEALRTYGPGPIHRLSWVSKFLN